MKNINNTRKIALAMMFVLSCAGLACAAPGIQDINRFAFELYSNSGSADRNILISPYAVFSAMAMVSEGARGKTSEEIMAALHFPGAAGDLKQNLTSLRDIMTKKERQFEFTSASALWASDLYSLHNDFISRLKQDYFGDINSLDFSGNSENSRTAINSWFESATGRRAKQPASEGLLGTRTKMVLTSAACLKTDWKYKFNLKDTKTEYFSGPAGKATAVEMMHAKMNALLDEEYWPGTSVLEMELAGNALSMVVFLPVDGDIAGLEKLLTPENLASWKEALEQTHHKAEAVDVSLPKFRMDSRKLLGGSLSQLGMPSVFIDADMSGMSGNKGLLISQAIHQAYLDVNEEGTEDAQVKASSFIAFRNMTMSIGKPAVFRADRPFIFIIRENTSGVILFIGKFVDPAEAA